LNLKILKILINIFMAFIIVSCSDIVNSDMNKVGVKKDGNSLLPELIEFRFDADFLTYQNGDSTTIWNILLPFTWAKTFNPNNSQTVCIRGGNLLYCN